MTMYCIFRDKEYIIGCSMKQFIVFSLSILVLFLAAPILAQETCTPVYGGGQNADGSPFCLEQIQAATKTTTPTPVQSGFSTPNDGLTKGGLTVYPSPNIASNPNTGPELFGLAVLIPAAAAGMLFRRKSHISSSH